MLVCPAFTLHGVDTGGNRSYILGPDDQVTVEVVELPETAGKSYRVDADGSLSLPLIGRVHAAGLSLAQLEGEVRERFRSEVRNPHVLAGLVDVRSQPVYVMGEVNNPGMQVLQGTKTLFDVLAMAGGLKPDAGDVVRITRRNGEGPLNLPGSAQDPASATFTAEVDLREVTELRKPDVNIAVRPHDSIFIPRAKVVYVIGNVRKAGGFTLSHKRSMTALEALSNAEGLSQNAAAKSARIVRRGATTDAPRQDIPINLKALLAGKTKDVELLPNDVLYVPDNGARRTSGRVLETALSTISGLIIWRGF
jgi:polysaccharide export outer membrane protein